MRYSRPTKVIDDLPRRCKAEVEMYAKVDEQEG
jgi:hypothetical protein